MRPALVALCVALSTPVLAQDQVQLQMQVINDVVENHVMPRYAALTETAETLDAAAQGNCDPRSEDLRAAYNDAFDAWISVSHLRFGPSETDDRAYALAFWPDPRGDTPSALRGLIEAQDPVVGSQEGYAEVSIAARGFYPLEFLLYDEEFAALAPDLYHCALVQAIARDIAANAAAIQFGWTTVYATLLQSPGGTAAYRSAADVIQEFYSALGAGLEFTSDSRLARPMGSFDDPKPARAEARRSGRSLRHVQLSLAALSDLSARLAPSGSVAQDLEAAFGQAERLAAGLDDPIFEGVATPEGRFRVEALKTSVDRISALVDEERGPALGVAAGFNAADGD